MGVGIVHPHLVIRLLSFIAMRRKFCDSCLYNRFIKIPNDIKTVGR